MPRKKTARDNSKEGGGAAVTSIQVRRQAEEYPTSRPRSPCVVRETPRSAYEFNPHLPPVLRSSPDAVATDRLPELLSEAHAAPAFDWGSEAPCACAAPPRAVAGVEQQAGAPWFEVDPVALHMHERVSTQAILPGAGPPRTCSAIFSPIRNLTMHGRCSSTATTSIGPTG